MMDYDYTSLQRYWLTLAEQYPAAAREVYGMVAIPDGEPEFGKEHLCGLIACLIERAGQ